MPTPQEIKDAKENVKQAEADLEEAKKAIRQAEGSKRERLMTTFLNGVETVHTGACAGVHLGLKYATDKVENAEAHVTKLIHGVDEQETIKARKQVSAATQIKLKNSVNNLKEKMSNWTSIGTAEDEEVIQMQSS